MRKDSPLCLAFNRSTCPTNCPLYEISHSAVEDTRNIYARNAGVEPDTVIVDTNDIGDFLEEKRVLGRSPFSRISKFCIRKTS